MGPSGSETFWCGTRTSSSLEGIPQEGLYLALFATALLPGLPLDDFIYVGAGASGASLELMSLVTLLAKLVKSAFEVAVEFTILKDVGRVFDFNRLDATLALSALFLLIGIGIYKLDWEKAYRRLRLRKPGTPPETGAIGSK